MAKIVHLYLVLEMRRVDDVRPQRPSAYLSQLGTFVGRLTITLRYEAGWPPP